MSAPPGKPPPAEISIDAALVRRLLAEQQPDLESLDITLVAEGWDNILFRLGDDMLVRLPRRAAAAGLMVHEQAWLPQLARSLSLPIPAPIRSGRPSAEYPWHWSVLPWIHGSTALDTPLLPSQAGRLGEFLRGLHTIAVPDEPPRNPYRGGPLPDRLATDEERLHRLAAGTAADSMVAELAEILAMGSSAPLDVPPVWLHGDLHAKNVVSRDGTIASIIDWGDICTGDPATDLAAVWRLFPSSVHGEFWDAYGVPTEATLRRSAAWAVAGGLMIWDSHHLADPAFAAAALETLSRVGGGAGR